jgi:hypothetical protein
MEKYPSGTYLLILFKDGKENGCYKIVKAWDLELASANCSQEPKHQTLSIEAKL